MAAEYASQPGLGPVAGRGLTARTPQISLLGLCGADFACCVHVARDLVEMGLPRAAAPTPNVDVRVLPGQTAHELTERRRVAGLDQPPMPFQVPYLADRKPFPFRSGIWLPRDYETTVCP